MTTWMVPGQANLGRVFDPKGGQTVSYRTGGKVQIKHAGIVTASVLRPRWAIEDPDLLPEGEDPKTLIGKIDPQKFATETIWCSITHNERVDIGASVCFQRLLGMTGTVANGVATPTAVATTGFTTKTKTDLSIGVITASVTTNEFTTIGLSRGAADSTGTYTIPASLNAVASGNVVKTFSVTGSGTAHGAALFDQVVVASSNLYVEDIYSSDATVINGDSLQNTWTIQQ